MKLQGGEYIAIERLESIYKSCTYISNICVHATTEAKQPIAIIIPHEGHLRQGLESVSGVDAKADFATLCSHAKVQELVLKDCNAAGKKNGFKPMELLQGVILTADEWTPESGLVTAAQKLQRKKVAEKYDKEIKVRGRLCFVLECRFAHCFFRRRTRARTDRGRQRLLVSCQAAI